MDGRDQIAQALDGATGDYAVSGDAMRWSPDLARLRPLRRGALPRWLHSRVRSA